MSRPKRLDGVSYRGVQRYFLTICTRNRQPRFVDGRVAAAAMAQIRRTAAEDRFAVLAYCVMHDHVHLLVEGVDDASDLRRFVKLAKQRSGAEFALGHGTRLWQEGYYERVLRDADDTRAIARYIVENPIRAGYVADARDYPHVGSDVWPLDVLLDGIARG